MAKVYHFPKGTTVSDGAGYTQALVSAKLPDQATVEGDISDLEDTYNQSADTGEREGGESTITVPFELDNQPAIGGDDKTWTFTLPQLSGESSAGTVSFTGHITNITGPSLERGGTRMTQEITIVCNSAITYTPGS